MPRTAISPKLATHQCQFFRSAPREELTAVTEADRETQRDASRALAGTDGMEIPGVEEKRLADRRFEFEQFGLADDVDRISIRVGEAERLVGRLPAMAPHDGLPARLRDAQIEVERELGHQVRVEQVPGELAERVVEMHLEPVVGFPRDASAHFPAVAAADPNRSGPRLLQRGPAPGDGVEA